jgi:D-alanyl-lipoteichoic acid acyltransferase DltB (MBOAT superfamily)
LPLGISFFTFHHIIYLADPLKGPAPRYGLRDYALYIAPFPQILAGPLVLRANFDVPYRAASLREFWRRWHMTLSRFLRDYLYIPFGGNRDGLERQLAGLLATMTLADCGTAPVGPSSPGARCTGSASPPACCGAGASPRFPRPSAGRS